MNSSPAAPPPHVQRLIDALAAPDRCGSLGDHEWDLLVRCARSARLLGTFASRVKRALPPEAFPHRVETHLAGARTEARYCRQMTLYEMASVARVLAPLRVPLVLLKGAAYVAQDLDIAGGRLPRDLDLMVPRERLDQAEQELRAAGWRFDDDLDDYDQHYYRAWTHELPPMRAAGHAFELDLHHTILPPIGRLKPNTQALFDASIPVGDGVFRVLCPADQVLHAAAHLFQDSDCVGRLRDLVDFDGLVRELSAKDPSFWRALDERARLHQLGRPLWYSLTLCREWLETPVSGEAASGILAEFRPSALSRRLVLGLASQTLPPVDPDSEPTLKHRVSSTLLEFRALWLRMPPWTLAYHALRKAQRSLGAWWRGMQTFSA